jgi:hypothetical protein
MRCAARARCPRRCVRVVSERAAPSTAPSAAQHASAQRWLRKAAAAVAASRRQEKALLRPHFTRFTRHYLTAARPPALQPARTAPAPLSSHVQYVHLPTCIALHLYLNIMLQ